MRKIIIYLVLGFSYFFLCFPTSLWQEQLCETKSWYDLYKCREKNICEIYKPVKIIYEVNWEDIYKKPTSPKILEDIKSKYRINMNNIYKCALLKTQKNL